MDGGLAAGLVPQDLDVEGVQQPGLQGRREAGQHVPGMGELVEQGGVGGAGGGRGQGGQLGVELLAFVVQVGEPGADRRPGEIRRPLLLIRPRRSQGALSCLRCPSAGADAIHPGSGA